MSNNIHTLELCYGLARLAKPQSGEDWGSERQVEAENDFWNQLKIQLGDEAYDNIWGEIESSKMDVEEMIDYALTFLGDDCKLTDQEMTKIINDKTISDQTEEVRKQVMAFAFGEEFMASENKGEKQQLNQYEHKFDFLDGVIDIQFTITEEGKQFAFVGFQDETHNSVLHDGEVVWFGSNPEFIRKDMESGIKGQLLQEHGYSVIKANLLYSTFVKP